MKKLATIFFCSSCVVSLSLASPQSIGDHPASATTASTDTPKPRIKNPVLRCYDLDNNGKLTADENREYLDDTDSVKELPGDSNIVKVLTKWDSNGDGKLVDAEVTAAQDVVRTRLLEKCVTRFNEADTNHDNLLSSEEFGQTLTSAAADKSKAISENKFQLFFSFIDKDKNQFLSIEEFTTSVVGE